MLEIDHGTGDHKELTKVEEPDSTACEYSAVREKPKRDEWVGSEFSRRLPEGKDN